MSRTESRPHQTIHSDAPVDNVPADNIALQFVVANSVYRENIAHAKDKAATLAALDAGVNGYRAVLKNATRDHDAAYNYEYLLRLRDEVEQGKKKAPLPAEVANPQGEPGRQPVEGDVTKFKVYVPLEQQEIDKTKAAGIYRHRYADDNAPVPTAEIPRQARDDSVGKNDRQGTLL